MQEGGQKPGGRLGTQQHPSPPIILAHVPTSARCQRMGRAPWSQPIRKPFTPRPPLYHSQNFSIRFQIGKTDIWGRGALGKKFLFFSSFSQKKRPLFIQQNQECDFVYETRKVGGRGEINKSGSFAKSPRHRRREWFD